MSDECNATMSAWYIEGHKHSCTGQHDRYDAHWCPGCGRWWYADGDDE